MVVVSLPMDARGVVIVPSVSNWLLMTDGIDNHTQILLPDNWGFCDDD